MTVILFLSPTILMIHIFLLDDSFFGVILLAPWLLQLRFMNDLFSCKIREWRIVYACCLNPTSPLYAWFVFWSSTSENDCIILSSLYLDDISFLSCYHPCRPVCLVIFFGILLYVCNIRCFYAFLYETASLCVLYVIY